MLQPTATLRGRSTIRGYGLRRAVGLYLELGKARLSALVLLTTLVGFVLGSGRELEVAALCWTLLGTGLAALGANALNQYAEVARDARMDRTRGRPLPAGALTPHAALVFGLAAGVAGPGILAVFVNGTAAVLAMGTLTIYVFIYTPLKTITPVNTVVGAVVGGLPPLIGWAAAVGTLAPGAWVLGGILFLWQIPHFLALAWLYREDYARGGFRMLPSIDATGDLTGCIVVVYTLSLIPTTLSLSGVGVTGVLYAVGATVLGVGLLALTVRLERQRTALAARRVFVGSVIYLPLLLGLMLLDRQRPTVTANAADPPVTLRSATWAGAPPAVAQGQDGGRR